MAERLEGQFGPEGASLLRSRLEPQEARTMTVTKQASAPVYLFLVGAVRAGPADENNLSETSIDPRPPALASRPASCSPLNEPSNPDSFPQILFFSACVAGLVVSARPEFWTVERDVVPDGMGAALGGNVDDVLAFDDTWFPQGKTADEVKIDHAGIGAENRKQEDFEPQSGFERWRGAPYWQHYTEMPVEYNLPRARMQAKDVVVATHTTDKDASKLFMASIHKHGLAASVSGVGTWWHSHEDKEMGLKASLLRLPADERHDPLVILADSDDSMFTCDAEEMLSRFEDLDADIVVGTETRCWPPEASHCGDGYKHLEEGVRAGMEVRSELGRVESSGDATHDTKPTTRIWGDAGAIVGRRSALVKLLREFESFLEINPKYKADQGTGARWGAFYKSCKPFGVDTKAWREAVSARPPRAWIGYDDQMCLNRYLIERSAAKDARVKLDRDATLVHAVGGTSSQSYATNPKTGRPFWKATSKSPCVWHFNTPAAAEEMRPMIRAYPDAFV